MRRNKLLGPPVDLNRCTGRTTAIALDVIARAITDQGCVKYAKDHHGHLASRMLVGRVNELIAKLDLKHIKVNEVCGDGQYAGHIRVVSEIWE